MMHQKLTGRAFTSCSSVRFHERLLAWTCRKNRAERCTCYPGFRCPDDCQGYVKKN